MNRIAFALLLVLAVVAQAAPKRTHMIGSFLYPDGSIPRGTVGTRNYCSLTYQLSKPMKVLDAQNSAISYTIASVAKTIIVTNPASVAFPMEPNAGSTPAGTFYSVTLSTELGEFPQQWEIPDTTSNVYVSDVVRSGPVQTSQAFVYRNGDTVLGTLILSGLPSAVLTPQAEPTSPVTGTIYFDSTSLLPRTWNGSAWVTASTNVPTAGTAGQTIYSNGSAWTALAAGTSSQVYRGGSAPSWGAVPLAAAQELIGLADLTDVAMSGVTRGDQLVRGASTWGRSAIGLTGRAWVSDGTDPGWVAAGGDVSGPFSALVLASTGVGAATYGSATQVPVVQFDVKGRAVTASNVTISGVTPAAHGSSHAAAGSDPMQVSATDRGLGRVTSGAGAVEEYALTAAGRALLDDASNTDQRATLGLVIGTDVQAQSANLQALAGLTGAADKAPRFTGAGAMAVYDLTSYGRTLAALADAAAGRAALDLEPGVDVQAQDNELQALSGVTAAADRLPYFDSGTTAALATFTSFSRTLLDDANAAAMQGTLGVPPNERTISAGTGLTGGGDLSANRTLTLADTAVTIGTYGSATASGQFQVDQQGRLVAAASVALAITNTQVAAGAEIDPAKLLDGAAGQGLATLSDGTSVGWVTYGGDVSASESGGTLSVQLGTGVVGAAELSISGVSAGSYSLPTLQVDEDGRITSISSGAATPLQVYQGGTTLASNTVSLNFPSYHFVGTESSGAVTLALATDGVTATALAPGAAGAAGAELANSIANVSGDLTVNVAGDELILPAGKMLRYTDAPGAGALGYFDTNDDMQALAAGTSSDLLRGGSTPSWGAAPLAALQEVAGLTDLSDVVITSAARGDLLRRGASGWVNFAKGNAGEVLYTDGTDALWVAFGGDVSGSPASLQLGSDVVGAAELAAGTAGAAGAELANSVANVSGDLTIAPAGDEIIIPTAKLLRITDGTTGALLYTDASDDVLALPAGTTDQVLRGSATAPTWGAVPIAAMQEVIALADLSDVTAKSGTGTTVIMQGSPTLTTPTLTNPTVNATITFADATDPANDLGTLVRNGAELSFGIGNGVATNVEQVVRKGAADGYAPTDGSNKVPSTHLTEVINLADLADVAITSDAAGHGIFRNSADTGYLNAAWAGAVTGSISGNIFTTVIGADQVTVAMILDGTANQMLVTNAAGTDSVWASTAGDVTGTESGGTYTFAIGSGVIVNADVNASAGITYGKLAFSDNIIATDLATNSVGALEIVGGVPGASGAELADTVVNITAATDLTIDPTGDEVILPTGVTLRYTDASAAGQVAYFDVNDKLVAAVAGTSSQVFVGGSAPAFATPGGDVTGAITNLQLGTDVVGATELTAGAAGAAGGELADSFSNVTAATDMTINPTGNEVIIPTGKLIRITDATTGSLLYTDSSDDVQALAAGANTTVLVGGASLPVWTAAGGDVSGAYSNLQIAANVVGAAEITDGIVGGTGAELANTIVNLTGATDLTIDPTGDEVILPTGVDLRWTDGTSGGVMYVDSADKLKNVTGSSNQVLIQGAPPTFGLIADANIAAAGTAEIAVGKLQDGAASQLVGTQVDGSTVAHLTVGGDLTALEGSGTLAFTIAANSVTLAKLATVATNTVLGREAVATGNVEALTLGSTPAALGTAASAGTEDSTVARGTHVHAAPTVALTPAGAADATTALVLNAGIGATGTATYSSGTKNVTITGWSSFRNALRNSSFTVAQRGASVAAIDGAYGIDGWKSEFAGTATFTQIQDTAVVPTVAQAGYKIPYSLKLDCTASDTQGSGDLAGITQPIEGQVWAALAEGPMVLSFWVRSPKTGTHYISIWNGTDRCYVAKYSVSGADTWEFKEEVIRAYNGGTWNYTTGTGAIVRWALQAGTDFDDAVDTEWTTTDEWAAGAGADPQANCMDSTSNNFYIAAPQLEPGLVATRAERVDPVLELQRCLPHLYVIAPGALSCVAVGQAYATNATLTPIVYPQPMRASPTLTVSAASDWSQRTAANVDNTATGVSLGTGNVYCMLLNVSVTTSNLTAGHASNLFGLNANSKLIFSAEL